MNEIKNTAPSTAAAVENSPSNARVFYRPVAPAALSGRSSDSGGTLFNLRPDRFIASEGVAGNAVYDVRDIRRGRYSRVSLRVQPMMVRLRGEMVTQKVLEIPLAMGKKRLSIYRKDE